MAESLIDKARTASREAIRTAREGGAPPSDHQVYDWGRLFRDLADELHAKEIELTNRAECHAEALGRMDKCLEIVQELQTQVLELTQEIHASGRNRTGAA